MFDRMRNAVVQAGGDLPSVSQIAREKQDPYRVLISTLLSLRTKDQVTLEASRRLFALADTPQAMVRLSQKEIEQAIFPAGFYQRKAQQILSISHLLIDRYGGAVPADQKALMDLPGVGIKTANLTLNLGFGINALCVDCHVHQIANRMGWVKTKSPEETEKGAAERHATQTLDPDERTAGILRTTGLHPGQSQMLPSVRKRATAQRSELRKRDEVPWLWPGRTRRSSWRP
jgi:endonuclease-3